MPPLPRRGKLRHLISTAALILATVAACGRTDDPEQPRLVIFAAASLQEVVGALVTELAPRAEVVTSFAGSNVLARQIAAAPGAADVFLSADSRWMDELEAAGRLEPGTRRDVLGNQLVVVGRTDASWRSGTVADLPSARFRRLALGDPAAVPVGRYARAALEHAGVWDGMAERVVPTSDARAALALVESDPEVAGVVYATDARTSERVVVHHGLDPAPGQSVVYVAAAVRDAPGLDGARRFLDFFHTPEARAIVAGFGFTPLLAP